MLAACALLDDVVPSGEFTPHVMLAYYRPDPPAPLDVDTLAHTLRGLTRKVEGTEVNLAAAALTAEHFSDMATCWTVC